MLKILIDCRFAGSYSGLGRYSRSIARELLDIKNGPVYQLLVRSKNEEWIPNDANLIIADIPHYSLAEQTQLPGIIRQSGADLFFSPHFNVSLFCPIPFVVTVHDLILHRYPNQAPLLKRLAYKVLVKHAVTKAKSVIAVSDFTKKELVNAYGSEKKIHVILEGIDEQYRPASENRIRSFRDAHNLQLPFLLYVGNAKQHKNVRVLIEAFAQSTLSMHAELVLLTGGAEAASLEPLPHHVRFLRDIPDDQMPALYNAASACVTASLYEGFCLPVAEALACGCPVIASNTAAIPQIASGRATLVEPAVEALAKALSAIPARPTPFRIAEWKDAALQTQRVLVHAL